MVFPTIRATCSSSARFLTTITGKARRYGLHTDASHRYERGVDLSFNDGPPSVQRSCCSTSLVVRRGPLEAVDEVHVPTRHSVTLRARIGRLLGRQIDAEVVEDVLIRLGMSVNGAGDTWEVTPWATVLT